VPAVTVRILLRHYWCQLANLGLCLLGQLGVNVLVLTLHCSCSPLQKQQCRCVSCSACRA
jgi:hypothetical protein